MKKFTVTAVSTKFTFSDGKELILAEGSSIESSHKYDEKLTAAINEHGDPVSAEVISYLAHERVARKQDEEPVVTPTLRLSAKTFGRTVRPGHSFKADVGSLEISNGFFRPKTAQDFKVQRFESAKPTVSYEEAMKAAQAGEPPWEK